MTTDPALAILMTLLLIAHLGTLHLLRGCGSLLGRMAEPMQTSAEEVRDWSEGVTRNLGEVCAIGSDLADLIEGLVDGKDSAAFATQSGPTDLPSTILSLIASRVLPALDGGTTEQEWAIHQQQADAPPVLDLDDDGNPTAL